MKKHWFLPQTPDVLGTLNRQAAVTVDGMRAFVLWANGDPEQATVLREAEHSADKLRRELAQQLRVAFTTPIDAEDLFTLSERLDAVLNMAKNVVRDADLSDLAPNEATADMAREARTGVQHLAAAFAALPKDPTTATVQADAATKTVRHVEKRYSRAIREIVDGSNVHRALLQREHFQQCLQVGERVELVADRVWYAVVKEQ